VCGTTGCCDTTVPSWDCVLFANQSQVKCGAGTFCQVCTGVTSCNEQGACVPK
jgi:hypothetical protein